jgi:3-polyprenyl-4-hydroxybenzoate decarboxylase
MRANFEKTVSRISAGISAGMTVKANESIFKNKRKVVIAVIYLSPLCRKHFYSA